MFAHNGDLQIFSPRMLGSLRLLGNTGGKRASCWIMQKLLKSHADLPSMAELTLREQCRFAAWYFRNFSVCISERFAFQTGSGSLICHSPVTAQPNPTTRHRFVRACDRRARVQANLFRSPAP